MSEARASKIFRQSNPADTVNYVKCVLKALQDADIEGFQMPTEDSQMGRYLIMEVCTEALEYASDQITGIGRKGKASK